MYWCLLEEAKAYSLEVVEAYSLEVAEAFSSVVASVLKWKLPLEGEFSLAVSESAIKRLGESKLMKQ